MKTLTCAILVFLFLLPTSAFSQESLRLNGITTYNKHYHDYFIAALFLKQRNHSSPNILENLAPSKISMKILKPQLSARKFNQYWLEAISINNNQQTLADYSDDILRFTSLIDRPLLREDEISISLSAQRIIKIQINQQSLAEFSDAQFFNVILRGWIGKRPPSGSFKSQLLKLGKDSATASLVDTYTNMHASATRKKESKGWSKDKSGNTKKKHTKITKVITTKIIPTQNTSLKKKGKPQLIISKTRLPLTVNSKTFSLPVPIDKERDKKIRQNNKLIYRSNVLKETYRHIIYPNIAIDGHLEGDIILTIIVNREGKVITLNQNQLSPHHSLNSAAIKAVRLANYPPAPHNLPGEEFMVKLPIKFRLPK